MVHFACFDTEINVNNRFHTGGRDVRIYGRFSPARGRNPILRTFPAAMCASKPLAIDLGVKNDPPSFREYQTEPGSCAHTSYPLSRTRCMIVFAAHVGRLISAVVINTCGLEGQEPGVFVARCTAGLIDVVLEVLHEDTLAGAHN